MDRRRFDPADVLARYLAWWRDEAFDTGPTAATVLSLIEGGMDAAEAVERVHEQSGGMTAGCNPAHRCAPLATASFLADGDLAGCALREARLTHQHPLAGDVAAAVAVLCRTLIRGGPWPDSLAPANIGRLRPTIEALAGARWGAVAIPLQVPLGCDLLGRVRDVSDRLADEWEEMG